MIRDRSILRLQCTPLTLASQPDGQQCEVGSTAKSKFLPALFQRRSPTDNAGKYLPCSELALICDWYDMQ